MIDLQIDNLLAFFEKGGYVLYFVFFIAIFLWTLLIERFVYINFKFQKYRDYIFEEMKKISEENKFKKEIKRYFVKSAYAQLTNNQKFIKVLIMICPLVGLLGTVTGMIEVFDVMAITGTSNVKSMANGVSMATIPTMAGMVVALSGILFEKRLESSIKEKNRKLEFELSKVI